MIATTKKGGCAPKNRVARYGKKAASKRSEKMKPFTRPRRSTSLQQRKEEKHFEAQENKKGCLTGLFGPEPHCSTYHTTAHPVSVIGDRWNRVIGNRKQ